MKSVRNRIQLIGNLGQTPEVKEFEDGKKASFSLATNDVYTTKKGGKKIDTQWHNIVAWGKMATIVEQYLKKGAEVIVEGRLLHRSYEDSDGNTRYISEISANEVIMMRQP